jgi:peptidyl-prolyl cis-trans isomerase B (cyclophilin B)
MGTRAPRLAASRSAGPKEGVVPSSAQRRQVQFLTAAVSAAFTVGAMMVLGAGATASAAPPAPASAPPAGPVATHGPCHYTATPDDPAARPVPLPPDPRRTPGRGFVQVVLRTNHGPIPLLLDRAKAPCTVQNFLHLVRHRFYDRTICHRLTAYPTLKVLQCGDPSGTGEGGPGYQFKDELPTDLPPAPTDPTGVRRLYARATLAMANAGPDTNGSQFFLVYADSALRPNYTIFGTVRRPGLSTVDRIAAGGVQPTADDPAPVDGAPALRTEIVRALAGGHRF